MSPPVAKNALTPKSEKQTNEIWLRTHPEQAEGLVPSHLSSSRPRMRSFLMKNHQQLARSAGGWILCSWPSNYWGEQSVRGWLAERKIPLSITAHWTSQPALALLAGLLGHKPASDSLYLHFCTYVTNYWASLASYWYLQQGFSEQKKSTHKNLPEFVTFECHNSILQGGGITQSLVWDLLIAERALLGNLPSQRCSVLQQDRFWLLTMPEPHRGCLADTLHRVPSLEAFSTGCRILEDALCIHPKFFLLQQKHKSLFYMTTAMPMLSQLRLMWKSRAANSSSGVQGQQ